ncbi:hypothetical protein BKA65DRAFT_477066 [Rhexocercosporidium sp. MPI-PUGE-AT-0058]|nr:hypothetical protein BKA65DRAFT_477066 [Rhexocercosporidium sp. MPI-PUGE-AT-0058]
MSKMSSSLAMVPTATHTPVSTNESQPPSPTATPKCDKLYGTLFILNLLLLGLRLYLLYHTIRQYCAERAEERRMGWDEEMGILDEEESDKWEKYEDADIDVNGESILLVSSTLWVFESTLSVVAFSQRGR